MFIYNFIICSNGILEYVVVNHIHILIFYYRLYYFWWSEFYVLVMYGNILVKGIRLMIDGIEIFICVDTTIKHGGMF